MNPGLEKLHPYPFEKLTQLKQSITQETSVIADKAHVQANKDLYREKFDAVLDILKPVMNVSRPDASFYLWPETPISEIEFAAGLYSRQNITVLPGSFLSRSIAAGNPGKNRIRIALVAKLDQCIEAAERMCEVYQGYLARTLDQRINIRNF